MYIHLKSGVLLTVNMGMEAIQVDSEWLLIDTTE